MTVLYSFGITAIYLQTPQMMLCPHDALYA